MDCYIERTGVLNKIGFDSYREYLLSKLWKSIRKRVFKGKPQCSVCRLDPITQVHHVNYSEAVLLGKDRQGLTPICGACHEIGEFYTDGTKTNLKSCNQRLKVYRSKASKRRAAPPASKVRMCSNPNCNKRVKRKDDHDVCNNCRRARAAFAAIPPKCHRFGNAYKP